MPHNRPRIWHLGLGLVLMVIVGEGLASVGGCQNPFEQVWSVAVQFASSVSYDQALRIVVDLGLAPVQPCINFDADWSPAAVADDRQYAEQWSAYSAQLLVSARDISAPDWLNRLRSTEGVSGVTLNPIYHCALNESVTPVPGGRYYLPEAQTGTLVRVTFSGDTGYATALARVIALGFQLADPCYPNPRHRPPVTWTPMGQEHTFGQAHAFLLITTRANSTQWQQQIQSAIDVTGVQFSPAVSCP
jgi:hypothetical protein